ncbi:MAG: sigma-70 family RNA polymerase sigma factor [Chitinophagales bacterium]|nr:sigma-70 family RNA polymerase sigma factor [Chitinophagales bacterium]MCZ2393230.1 sigma-70 family RNA polymerase sigma factor [Chitinophagales bacterium]
MKTKQLSDLEIIHLVLNGEKPMYELIVRRYNPYLYKIGKTYHFTHEDTMDIMQDTFVATYKNLENFKGHSSFKTWIVKIMVNNCFQRREKLSFKKEILKDMNDVHETSKPLFSGMVKDIHHQLHNKELASIIENTLSKIPESYRIVFTLREIEEMSVAETAEILGISSSNVKVRLNRAKTMLREHIEKSYTPIELFEFNLIYCDAMVERVFKQLDK